jgi:phage-related protein
VIFTVHGELILPLQGFIKKTQKTPHAEIKLARSRLAQLREQSS